MCQQKEVGYFWWLNVVCNCDFFNFFFKLLTYIYIYIYICCTCNKLSIMIIHDYVYVVVHCCCMDVYTHAHTQAGRQTDRHNTDRQTALPVLSSHALRRRQLQCAWWRWRASLHYQVTALHIADPACSTTKRSWRNSRPFLCAHLEITKVVICTWACTHRQTHTHTNIHMFNAH